MMGEWPTWKKVVLGALGLLGTILIGAIGSGIWQRLGDPLYIWLRDALLTGTTFGIATLKDALYAEWPQACTSGLRLFSSACS